jgi:hypothetical protein
MADHVHRSQRMGEWVLISEDAYEIADQKRKMVEAIGMPHRKILPS